MSNTRFLAVRSLPSGIRAGLARAGYVKKDVQCVVADTVSLPIHANDGERAFACVVPRTDTAPGEMHVGPFGGENAFGASALALLAGKGPLSVPRDGALITGTVGRYAVVSLRASTLLAIVAPTSDVGSIVQDALLEGRSEAQAIALEGLAVAVPKGLTYGERWTLYAYRSLKSGPYRAEYLARLSRVTGGYAGSESMLVDLVARGYLRRSSNGATAITTSGKDARPVESPYGFQMSADLAELARERA